MKIALNLLKVLKYLMLFVAMMLSLVTSVDIERTRRAVFDVHSQLDSIEAAVLDIQKNTPYSKRYQR